MTVQFYKFEGCGNDFVIIDNREGKLKITNEQIRFLCDRHFGAGADGLMLYGHAEGFEFSMKYFNADGFEGTMCGNGGRCIIAFAEYLKDIKNTCRFIAIDGEHQGEIITKLSENQWQIKLKMTDVTDFKTEEDHFEIDTGSPHYVKFMDQIDDLDVSRQGQKIRYGAEYNEKGINVNFVQQIGKNLFVRTYERGVENETLACGTGVTASALAFAIQNNLEKDEIKIKTLGGSLKVSFEKNKAGFQNIWLEGPATFVFKGEINI